MSGILSPARELAKRENLALISDIAKQISALARTLPPPADECDNYLVDVGADEITPSVDEPSPFGL